MQRNHLLSQLIVSLVLVAITGQASADTSLIKDVESLRNGLTAKDPSRSALTLRLADLYFDQIGEVARNPNPTPQEAKDLAAYRRRAVSLYTEALEGDGFSTPASGSLRTKLQFQLARLYSDLEQEDRSRALWRQLVAQTDLTDIRREAALRLAEAAEKQSSPASQRKADEYYQLAIQLCGGGDVCSYGHYRRAWLYKNGGKLDLAVPEMQLALVDSKGQVREEALRDLIVFLAGMPGNGESQLLLVENLSARFQRPTLMKDLSDAFYSAGNRAAGTKILGFVNAKAPTLKNEIRLLEEYYGMRDWDKFHEMLESVRATAAAPAVAVSEPAATSPGVSAAPSSESVESEKILRRLTVQLDGERLSQPKLAVDFKNVVLTYLEVFPASPERVKMIEGWIAAESDPKAKMDQLKLWVVGTKVPLTPEFKTKLRETRASVALKAKDYATAAEEMAVLAAETKDTARAREYAFHQAGSLYALKQYEEALPLFRKLAAPASFPNGRADLWAVKSQHLVLEMLGTKKDYGAVIAQSDTWINNASLKEAAEKNEMGTGAAKLEHPLTKDLAELKSLRQEAEFEGAVASGESKDALQVFKTYCVKGTFLPKSCENARVLSVKFKDQPTLFAVLKAQGKTSELADEYEAAGYFAESAALLESGAKTGSEKLPQQLKVALLYELGGKTGDRDRVLRTIMAGISPKKALADAEEALIFQTLKEAGLLKQSALGLPWSPTYKARLASELEAGGVSTPITRKTLLDSKSDLGPAWTKLVMEQLRVLDVKQRKIAFYGKRAKNKFELRLKAVKDLEKVGEHYLPGASAASRVEIAALLSGSYHGLAQEIVNSPIPEGLAPDQLEAVKQSLAQMAAPFEERAQSYEKTRAEQLAKVTEVSEKAKLEAKTTPETAPDGNTGAKAPELAASGKPAPAANPTVTLAQALSALHTSPSDPVALTTIKTIYESQGQARLAAYFQGRLLQLQKEGGTP